MKSVLKNILFLLLFTGIFSACSNDETCRRNRYVMMNVNFYSVTLNANKDTAIAAYTLDSVTAKGVGVDSVLYKNIKSRNKLALPLNQFAGVSKFAIAANNKHDTLTVYYQNKYEFLSLECGNIRTHFIDSAKISGHYFYKIFVFKPDVNTLNAENIKLYHFGK